METKRETNLLINIITINISQENIGSVKLECQKRKSAVLLSSQGMEQIPYLRRSTERYNSEFSIEDATLSIQREQNRGRIGKQSTSTNEILKIKHLHRKTKHVLMESSR